MRSLTKTLLCLFATLPSAYAVTLILGDTGGNARGSNAIDIQAARYSATEVASGSHAVAIGMFNTASGSDSITVGRDNSTSGSYNVSFGLSNWIYSGTTESAAVGLGNEVTGAGGLAFGYANTVFDNYGNVGGSWYGTHQFSSAFGAFNSIEPAATRSYVFGRGNTATATDTGVFGADITNGVTGSLMIGPSDVAKVTILSSGNVGIGTTAPTSKLQVVGDLNVTGTIINSGIATTGTGSTARLRVGGTANPSASWQATSIVGADGQNKVVTGYLGSSTNGAVIGAHNSALSGWADLNVAGSNVILRTNETERMRVGSNGNVGINTTNPLAKLEVDTATNGLNFPLVLKNRENTQTGGNAVALGFLNDADANGGWWKAAIAHERKGGYGIGSLHFLVNNAATNASTTLADAKMTITKEGNIGIGTTAPSSKLTVLASGAIDSSVSSDRDFYVTIAGPNRTVSSGTTSGQVGIFANDAALLTGAGGSLALGATYNTSGHLAINAVIQSGRDNSVNGNYGGYMSLFTRPHGGNATERIRIASDGKVGINTPFPSEQLHVAGNARVTGNVTVGGTMLTVNGYGVLTSGGGYGANLIALNASNISDGTLSAARLPTAAVQVSATQTLTNKTLSGAKLTGATTLGGSTAAQQVLVDASGNVGVGTSTPGAKLHVNGNAVVQGSITSDGTISASEVAANYITFGFGLSELYIESYAMPGSPEMWIHGGDALGLYASDSISLMSNEVRIGLDAYTGPAIKAAVTPGSAPQTYDNQDLILQPSGNGRLVVASTAEMAGNVAVKNRGVVRISPAGDIGMGDFHTGYNPETGLVE